MLHLNQITKDYMAGTTTIQALKGIDLTFRDSEFVSILGPSGCGKTTMLNLLGGLDRYTTGDLVINEKSTKSFKDRDWDTYRNHSIGFVFQNYNLIPHQTVLSNVELALTLSGVSKAERRQRAIEVLSQVGLADQVGKKPSQMSGGQMQRVAIARALVNNPDILLADEPTGALDSETSLQIMEILKEIAKDRLIIMVTHNRDLAEQYSTRIIRLLDGQIIDDSNPCTPESQEAEEKKSSASSKTSMSFSTAMALSFNNLLTKKARTFMTAFAGSIGIIGIALILSLSSGFQGYIDKIQKDTLSTYPLTIEEMSTDLTSLMESMNENQNAKNDHDTDKVYSENVLGNALETMVSTTKSNDLKSFKKHLDSSKDTLEPWTTAVSYSYDIDLNLYRKDEKGNIQQVNPFNVFGNDSSASESSNDGPMIGMGPMGGASEIWSEMLDNQELLDSQYDVISGAWPADKNEAVLVLDEHNEVNDYALYALGLKDASEIQKMMQALENGKVYTPKTQTDSFTYDDILKLSYKLILNPDFYQKSDNGWTDMRTNTAYMNQVYKNAMDINICGIIKPAKGVDTPSINGSIAYTSELTKYIIDKVNNSDIAKAQMDNQKNDVFTGTPFSSFNTNTVSYENNLEKLGVLDLNTPNGINIYPVDFNAKKKIEDFIQDYNKEVIAAGNENQEIQYTDYIGLMMSSVSTIINAISYVLIAFVSISLIVSSIMIGIITYISVLERTKEIGILKSIGASKKDISRVFNAETLLIGLVSGILGIVITIVLNFPINAVIHSIADVEGVAKLPVWGGTVLVILSMLLTLIAGLIPSRVAAKKDPVVALRSE